MTTKEKIILQSIEVIEKRISEIEGNINFNPFTELIKLRMQTRELLEKHKTVEERASTSFMAQLSIFAEKEKKIRAFAEKCNSLLEFFDEKAKLKSELSDLKNELYYIEQDKKRKAK